MPTDSAKDLHAILLRTRTSIAAAESLTVGLVQAALGSCSGSSAYLKGGITAYTLDAKVKHLGIDRGHAVQVNCVSKQVAREMAAGVREMFGAEIGISTTGYAEPDPAQGVEVPFAWVGFNVLNCYWETRIEVPLRHDREAVQDTVASRAILLLVEWFEEQHGEGHDSIPAVATLLDRGL
jgi:nicotinamide-nucleotide amidase